MVKSLHSVLVLLFICSAQFVVAQNISVASFKLLESDLTANTTGTMERDQNGEVAALIKVVTTEQGFVFDGGMSGIVKTKQGVGEVWVYVPHGIRRITIQHPQLGVLRDYYFPIPIEKAKTYEMKLTTGKVETLVTHAINKQFVVFEVTPSNASVELNDELLSVDADGHAEKNVPFGKYQYRVSAHNYHTEAGVIEVNDSENKHILKINLRPNFGWFELPETTVLSGADIYVDGERVGRAPMKSEPIKSGIYKLKIVKPLYKPFETKIEVKDGEVTRVEPTLVPNFATTTLTTSDGADIYIDGVLKGTGSWIGPLEKGDYTVEARKEGHRSTSIIVHITTNEERTIQLLQPIPILSSVEITSMPSSVTVMLDGKEIGITPLLLPNVLVGKHKVTFLKKNYQTLTEELDVKENETAKLHVEMSGECKLKVTTTPSEAGVSIDGNYIGTTPFEVDLFAGEHTFIVAKAKYKSIEEQVEIDGSRESLHFTLKRRYIFPKATYLDGGVSLLNAVNIYGAIGSYVNNFNLELSYAYGLMQSEPIFWNGHEEFYERSYTANTTNVKFGYGFILGNRVRLTPQIGCGVTKLMEKDSDALILMDANTISTTASLRLDIALFSHLALHVTPQYMLPLWSSPSAEVLRNISPTIKSWSEGFGLRAGITLLF